MEEGKGTIHFVMVHGYEGGAWCWYKVRTHLEESGYKVTCLDLKGSGIDPSTPDSILSFPDYNLPLIHFLDHHVDDDHKGVPEVFSKGPSRPEEATSAIMDNKFQRVTRYHMCPPEVCFLPTTTNPVPAVCFLPLKVFSLDSDHNPCFSAPLLLSGLLVHIATSSLPGKITV